MGGERYVKHFDAWQHLVIMLYAVIKRFDSLREITDSMFPNIVNSIEQSPTLYPHQDGNHIYNLQGQRTSRPTKGIHIIGGRKVLVK